MHLFSCSFHVWCILICYNILLSWRQGCPTSPATCLTQPTCLCPTHHHLIRRLRWSDVGSELANMTPRGSVVGFPFQNPWHSTRTESFTLSDELLQILNQQQRDLVQILRDLMRSCCYPTKSGPYLDRYGQFRPNLSGSGQISAPVIKREIDPNQPETKETRTEKSDQISGSVSGQIFIHLPHSSQV